MGKEHKFIDREFSAATVSTTLAGSELNPDGSLVINSVPEGTGPSERNGRICWFSACYIRGLVTFPAVANGASPNLPGMVNIWLIQDMQTNGATYNAEDVFQQRTESELEVVPFRNMEHLQRFRVLGHTSVKWDTLGGAGTSTSSDWNGQVLPFQLNVPLAMKTVYTGTGATIGTIIDNSLHVMAVGTGTAASIRFASRVRFYT